MSHKVKVFFSCLFILFMFASTAVANDMVWIIRSESAYAYHYDRNCQHLRNTKNPITSISISEAIQSGRTACKDCSVGSGGGGTSTGADLRAISRPRQQQTLTGFPAGTLPGGNIGGSGTGTSLPLGRIAMSGEPLPPLTSPGMVGSKLDHLSAIAGFAGYTLVKVAYSPTVIDTPYTFALMNGKRKESTLYFNHNMVLVSFDIMANN